MKPHRQAARSGLAPPIVRRACAPLGQRGGGMVEYALALVPFLLMVLGTLDVGRAAYFNHVLAHAAREGARAGVAAAAPSDMCRAALRVLLLPGVSAATRAGGCGAAGDLSVEATAGTPGDPAAPAMVTLSYIYRPITPLVSQFTGRQLTLRASSTMYVEQWSPEMVSW